MRGPKIRGEDGAESEETRWGSRGESRHYETAGEGLEKIGDPQTVSLTRGAPLTMGTRNERKE